MNTTSGSPTSVDGVWLGRMGFADALQRQLAARDALAEARGEPTLFAVEHPPVLTLGRRGSATDILWSAEQLRAAGVEVCDAPRGGQVTLHAPGQLVVYPVVRIGWRIRAHITQLGEAAAALVTELGVHGAEFRIEHPGVWIGQRKLASIGVHVSRGVTVQGVAINLDVDPSLFSSLVSCGLDGVPMTSVAAEGARSVSIADAARRYAALWAPRAGVAVAWSVAPA